MHNLILLTCRLRNLYFDINKCQKFNQSRVSFVYSQTANKRPENLYAQSTRTHYSEPSRDETEN